MLISNGVLVIIACEGVLVDEIFWVGVVNIADRVGVANKVLTGGILGVTPRLPFPEFAVGIGVWTCAITVAAR